MAHFNAARRGGDDIITNVVATRGITPSELLQELLGCHLGLLKDSMQSTYR
jgi:hypothetical protein